MQVNAHVAARNSGNPGTPAKPAKQPRRLETEMVPIVAKNPELRSYFEYSNHGVEVVEEGLKEMWFGEYLVEQGVLDRYQLFRALQMQDRLAGVRLGEAAAALGYVSVGAVEKHYAQLAGVAVVTVP